MTPPQGEIYITYWFMRIKFPFEQQGTYRYEILGILISMVLPKLPPEAPPSS